MGERKDRDERIRALRNDPDFRALLDELKKLPQERMDAFYDQYAPSDKEDGPDGQETE